jgi:DNA (cytosine-5)-methyltransferase 1
VLTTVHLFAGGFGDGRGYLDAGYQPLYAANHLQAAVDTARANCPRIWAQRCDINNLDMRAVPKADGIVGSPICTEVSPAAGMPTPVVQPTLDTADDQAPPADWNRTRMTAWDPIRYTEVHRPLFYAGENVPRFRKWPLFRAWLGVWDALGYQPHITVVNAAHDLGHGGLPQSRERLVWAMLRRDGRLRLDLRPRPRCQCAACGPVLGLRKAANGRGYVCPNRRCGHARVQPILTGIGTAIDWTTPGRPFGAGGEKDGRPYVAATRRRVEIGLDRYQGEPFMITLRNHGTASPMTAPIGTITAQGGEHHYLVRPTASGRVDDCEYRALTLAEKVRTQGFPAAHVFAGTETEQGLQVGNAVPVNVARWQAERIATAVARADLEAAA